MKHSLIIISFISIFLLFSCEDYDRIEAIKSELRNKKEAGKNDGSDSQEKVSISAPSQNKAAYESLSTNDSEVEDYSSDYNEEYSEDENYDDEYEDY